MLPLDGWLDALVEAAEASARVAVVGALQVNSAGDIHPLNCGWTPSGKTTMLWPATPHVVAPGQYTAVEVGWVSGAGSLVRVAAWDEVGGVDLRLWPLNFVDLAFSAHVRAHGYSVVHAPAARIAHNKRGSSTRALVEYTADRNTQLLDAAGWPEVVGLLGDKGARVVAHPCAPWVGQPIDVIEAEQLAVASNAYLPLMRQFGEQLHELTSLWVESTATAKRLDQVLKTASWRITAPLRVVMGRSRSLFRKT